MRKRKWIKSGTSIIVALLLCFSSISVFASSADYENSAEVLTIKQSDSGAYEPVTNRLFKPKGTLEIFVDNEFKSVYKTKDSRYFQETQSGTFTEVEPVSGSLTDYSTYQTMKNLNMPDEILNDIAAMAGYMEANELEGAGVTIFVPNQSTRSGINEVVHSSTEYAGETFTHYEVYFTELPSGIKTIKEGGASRSVWNGIKAVSFVVLEEVGSSVVEKIPIVGHTVNLFALGKGCVDAWEEATGETADTLSHNNYVQAGFYYTLYQKYTYIYDEDLDIERIGCRTKRIIITKLETRTYLFGSTGAQTEVKILFPYTTVKTLSYDSPEETAILFINSAYSQTENLKATVGGLQVIIGNYSNFTWPSHWPANFN